MGERIFTLNKNKDMPGHIGGDIIYQNVTNSYIWETAPLYEMSADLVENHTDFFTEYKHKFINGENCYFVDSNGRIYEVPFQASQHASLVVYGNIFLIKEDAYILKRKIDAIVNNAYIVTINDLQLLRSIVVNSPTENALLLIDKIIEQLS